MNLKRLCGRFREMRTVYVGTDVSFFGKFFYVLDYIVAFIVHGASISDYFAYGFYKLRYNGRKEYINCVIKTISKIITDRGAMY